MTPAAAAATTTTTTTTKQIKSKTDQPGPLKNTQAWRCAVPFIYELFNEWTFVQKFTNYPYCLSFSWSSANGLMDYVYAVLSDAPIEPFIQSDREKFDMKTISIMDHQRSTLCKTLLPLSISSFGIDIRGSPRI